MPFATLSEVKDYTKPETDDYDTQLQKMIGWAESLIREATGLKLTTPPVTERRTFDLLESRHIHCEDRLRDVTAVDVAEDFVAFIEGEVVDTGAPFSFYRLRDDSVETVVLLSFPLEGAVSITGRWGFTTQEIPSQIKQATLWTVDDWFRRFVPPFSPAADDDRADQHHYGLPDEVLSLLSVATSYKPGIA